jgi:hypothetical protein
MEDNNLVCFSLQVHRQDVSAAGQEGCRSYEGQKYYLGGALVL